MIFPIYKQVIFVGVDMSDEYHSSGAPCDMSLPTYLPTHFYEPEASQTREIKILVRFNGLIAKCSK